MKMVLAVFGVCLELGVAGLAASGTPHIQFDKSTYDFGTTGGVQSVTGTFTFSNVGDGDLSVENPKPSCGCTIASVNPDRLKPGETGELVFTLTTYNVGGLITKTISVPSNDPKNTNVVLTIQMDNQLTYVLTPTTLTLGDLRVGAVTNVTIEVKRTDGKPLLIDRAESGGAVDIQVERINDQTARLNLKMLAFGSPRRFNETIHVYADGETTAIGTATIYGRIVTDPVVSPK